MSNYKSVRELYRALGYIDPCPDLGKHNKAAQLLRSKEKAKFDISQYRISSRREWIGDRYFKVAVYEYKGIKYS